MANYWQLNLGSVPSYRDVESSMGDPDVGFYLKWVGGNWQSLQNDADRMRFSRGEAIYNNIGKAYEQSWATVQQRGVMQPGESYQDTIKRLATDPDYGAAVAPYVLPPAPPSQPAKRMDALATPPMVSEVPQVNKLKSDAVALPEELYVERRPNVEQRQIGQTYAGMGAAGATIADPTSADGSDPELEIDPQGYVRVAGFQPADGPRRRQKRVIEG